MNALLSDKIKGLLQQLTTEVAIDTKNDSVSTRFDIEG